MKEDIIEFERYEPKRVASDDYDVRLYTSGYLMLSEKVYEDWLKPAEKIDLYAVKGPLEKIVGIGIKAVDEGGLTLTKGPNSRGRQISARGFLKRFGVKLDGNMKLDCEFKQQEEMVIARFNGDGIVMRSKVGQTKINRRKKTPFTENGLHRDTAKRELEVLEIIPGRNSGKSPLSVRQITIAYIKKYEEIAPRKGSARWRSYINKIRLAVKNLEGQNKIKVDTTKMGRGKPQKFYYRLVDKEL